VLLFNTKGRFVRMIFDNRRPGSDPALDAEITRRGLKPANEITHRPPPPRKPKSKRPKR
jgi:hypothetical protein